MAAVPVMLGFRPSDSLVLVATGGRTGRRLGLTLRVDLPPPEHVETTCRAAAESLLIGTPAGAAVIVIGGAAATGADPPRRDVVGATVAALDGLGVVVHTAVWVQQCGAGARWACYDPCGCTGLLPDPGATPFAAAAAVAGHVVYADRSQLERLLDPVDPAVLSRREAMLTRSVDAALIRPDPAGALEVTAQRALVDAAIDETSAGRLHLDDAAVVALAGALVVPGVRESALARCAGPRAAAAEQLWAALTREIPDPEAAEPAALLAVSALLRGNGALAHVALDRAEQAWPGHRLTGILRHAVELGLRPDQIRAWLSSDDTARPAQVNRRIRRGRQRTRR
ncbi:MAG: DUF4192 domain-containing protein [Pseudonocardia sp.]